MFDKHCWVQSSARFSLWHTIILIIWLQIRFVHLIMLAERRHTYHSPTKHREPTILWIKTNTQSPFKRNNFSKQILYFCSFFSFINVNKISKKQTNNQTKWWNWPKSWYTNVKLHTIQTKIAICSDIEVNCKYRNIKRING